MPVIPYLRDFAPKAQPAFVRRAYARELAGELSFTFPMAMLEGGVVAVIATLLFDVGSFGLATIVAAPNFANITSTLWAKLLHGRAKAVMLAIIQAGVLGVLLAIAMLPVGGAYAAALVGLVVLARCCFAGVLTTRTVIWRANYPRHLRSRITGRLMLINTVMLATLPVAAATLFDRYQQTNPWLFRAVYLGVAAIGLISVFAVAGIRVRRERSLRRGEIDHARPIDDSGKRVRVSAIHVLRTDHHFRGYMVWQFFAGIATMTGNTAMIALIAEQVSNLDRGWRVDLPGPIDLGPYMVGTLLATAAVQALVALSLPFWAHYLDKVHVTRFRTRHGVLWIVTQVGNLVVAYLAASNGVGVGWLLALLVLPRMCQGLVFGGGRLAWQLGHHDFADRHRAATYMAIHQTLTGLRGFVGPYLGVLLYAGWSAHNNLFSTGLSLPAWSGIGYQVFAITTALAVIAWLGFVRLDKQVGGDGAAAAHD